MAEMTDAEVEQYLETVRQVGQAHKDIVQSKKTLEDRDSPTTTGELTIGSPGRVTPASLGKLRNSMEWADSGEWVSVTSSNVAGIAYKKHGKTLYVEFKSGAIYSYKGVLSVTAQDMFNSSSMGKFVHYRLKGRFPYQRLKDGFKLSKTRKKTKKLRRK